MPAGYLQFLSIIGACSLELLALDVQVRGHSLILGKSARWSGCQSGLTSGRHPFGQTDIRRRALGGCGF
jgi:hypothetical protein